MPTHKKILAALVLLIGCALLLYKFPDAPVGQHQDEMSEAYESYCLLHTGADRWGYRWPVYFIGWGSGQNVLQAYLTVPVIAAIGLNRVSARFIPILCGLLTLPLFFVTLRRWFGENVALLGLAFLVFCPWHIMFSRWGVENSPLPFFILLGIYTFGKALDRPTWGRVLPCFLPFVLALYTYGVMVVVLPFLLPLLCLIDLRAVLREKRKWLAATALFCVTSAPLFFFTFKNYVSHRSYAFEQHLPFSVPLLPVSRLAQVTEIMGESRLMFNYHFLRHGLSDRLPHNEVIGVPSVPAILLVLGAIGLAYGLANAVQARRFADPFLPWLLACVPLFFLMPVDMSRATPLYLPILALAAMGCVALYQTSRLKPFRIPIAAVVTVLFMVPVERFLTRYYGPVYASELSPVTHPELPDAFTRTLKLAGSREAVYVTDRILLNYISVLYLTGTDPRVFQNAGVDYAHPDFGRYHFLRSELVEMPRPFVFLIRRDEASPCEAPVETSQDGQFLIGECR